MERGYVKLYRKTKDSGILRHPKAFALFGWLLLSVTRKPHKVLVRSGTVELAPGEIVASRRLLAEELGQSEKEIRTSLELLRNADILTSRRAGRIQVLTLTNFAYYQEPEATKGQQSGLCRGQIGARSGPAGSPSGFDGLPLRALQEGEKERRRERERTPPPPEATSLAELLAKYLRSYDAKAKIPDDLSSWAWDVNKLLKLDGRTPEEVRMILRWIFKESDGFWIANVRSGATLRKKFETLVAQRKRDVDRRNFAQAKKADAEVAERAKGALSRPPGALSVSEVAKLSREEAAKKQRELGPAGATIVAEIEKLRPKALAGKETR